MHKKYIDQYEEFCDIRNKIFNIIKNIGYDIIEEAPIFYIMDHICGYSSYAECLDHYRVLVNCTSNYFNTTHERNKKNIKFIKVVYKRCLKFYKKEMELIK